MNRVNGFIAGVTVATVVIALSLIGLAHGIEVKHGRLLFPVISPLGNVELQTQFQTYGPVPQADNSAPYFLFAQLVRNKSEQPPFKNQVLEIADWAITPLGSRLFTQNCNLTQGATLVECRLEPNPGPQWSLLEQMPLAFRLEVESTDGWVATALMSGCLGRPDHCFAIGSR